VHSKRPPRVRRSGIVLDYEHPLAGRTKAVGAPLALNEGRASKIAACSRRTRSRVLVDIAKPRPRALRLGRRPAPGDEIDRAEIRQTAEDEVTAFGHRRRVSPFRPSSAASGRTSWTATSLFVFRRLAAAAALMTPRPMKPVASFVSSSSRVVPSRPSDNGSARVIHRCFRSLPLARPAVSATPRCGEAADPPTSSPEASGRRRGRPE
jgi:hypothetical protein